MKGWLSEADYLKVQALVPVLCIDAIMYNHKREVWAHFRTVIPHKNSWTIVGGRLWKHENILRCLARHVSESGLEILHARFAGYYDFERHDFRQHSVSLVFLVKVKGTPTMGRFFKVLPANMTVCIKRCIQTFFKIEAKGAI